MNKNFLLIIGLVALFLLGACARGGNSETHSAGTTTSNEETTAASGDLSSEKDSVSYILGMTIAKNLKNDGITDLNTGMFTRAMQDVFDGKDLAISETESKSLLQAYITKARQEVVSKNLQKGEDFLAANKSKDGVVTLDSGLQYQIMKEGTGDKPSATDKVKTHYHGTLIDGTVFDSSVDRGEPATFPVNGVIKGWTEALQLMPVGSKWKLFIPAGLAYGERGSPGGIGPNEALVFEVELLEIVK